ncbi:pentatricopeptide repeat-containing protein At5g27110 [Selaginella moellendorffii]|uniref:pentatricopeptide repeat-containing protein At5g27110 n=1 Tax=Selaginella moellendorffii TaxID=88036 RepID=UPI000D1C9916|nr:pentatricopeptide repeat-containing protein At5g27110 [Selaginella moellendorffii]|eukprot:XP_024518628.1 pentatricopeptide repeat-containing protein At5g27110 [Selaginella moellendorffii]
MRVKRGASSITRHHHRCEEEEDRDLPSVALLHCMLHEGIRPNATTLVTILKECSTEGSKKRGLWIASAGKLIESFVRDGGFDIEDRIGTSLVNMYRICGRLEDARRIFREFHSPSNVVTWTGIITANAESGHFSEAIDLFHRTQLEGVLLDKTSFLAVVNACADCGNLVAGRLAQRLVREAGLEADVVLGNTLVNMYGLCHSVDEACSVFDSIQERTSVSWNVMLSAHARQGNFQMSLIVFRLMQLDGFKPEAITFLAVLESCAAVGSLETGKLVHSNIQEQIGELDPQVGDAVVNMYGKCGAVEEAARVFDEQGHRRSVVSWNSMIAAFFLNVLLEEAFRCFRTMQLEGFHPNFATFVNLLHGCTDLEALAEGDAVYGMVAETEFHSEPGIEIALVNMYSSCGELDAAYQILQGRDDVSLPWSSFLRATARYGYSNETLAVLRRIQLNGIFPNTTALVSGLSACVAPGFLRSGTGIHELVLEAGIQHHLVVATALFVMYGKCKSLDHARLLFDGMVQRDSVAWNAIMSLYSSYGRHEGVIELFRSMLQEGVRFNRASFCIVLSSLVYPAMLLIGESVHSMAIQKNYDEDDVVAGALVTMYARLGKLEKAREIFDRVSAKEPSTALWTAMISACVEHREFADAQLLFRRMQLEGVLPDSFTLACAAAVVNSLEMTLLNAAARQRSLDNNVRLCNALVEAYGSKGELDKALDMFESTEEKTQTSWSLVITAAAENARHHQGLALYHQMLLEGYRPDKVSLLAALGVCSSLASLKSGRRIHEQVVEAGLEPDEVVASALVDMYGKCGGLEASRAVFQRSEKQDPVLWNSLLAVEARCGGDTMRLFHWMQQDGLRSDGASFVSLLAACSHAGVEDKAWDYFAAMKWDFGVVPASEHFGCMVDLLARTGKLEAAEELIFKSRLRLDSRLWITLLAACNANGDVSRVERAGMNALVLDPQNSGLYVTLGNMFAAAGREQDARNMRAALDELRALSSKDKET